MGGGRKREREREEDTLVTIRRIISDNEGEPRRRWREGGGKVEGYCARVPRYNTVFIVKYTVKQLFRLFSISMI